MQSIKDRNKQKIEDAKELIDKINNAIREIGQNFSQATLDKFQELFEKINIHIGINPRKEAILNLLEARMKNINKTLKEKGASNSFMRRLFSRLFKNRD